MHVYTALAKISQYGCTQHPRIGYEAETIPEAYNGELNKIMDKAYEYAYGEMGEIFFASKYPGFLAVRGEDGIPYIRAFGELNNALYVAHSHKEEGVIAVLFFERNRSNLVREFTHNLTVFKFGDVKWS